MERYIAVAQTPPKPPHIWLLFLSEYKRALLRKTILSNGKGHFGQTDGNDQTGQSGPPSKLVPNILVGPNPKWSVSFDVPTEISGILG